MRKSFLPVTPRVGAGVAAPRPLMGWCVPWAPVSPLTFFLLLVALKLVSPLQPQGVNYGTRQPQSLVGITMSTQSIHPCTGSRERFTQPDGVALRVKGWLVTSHTASEAGATGITGQDPL